MIIAILSMATAFSSYALDIDIDVTSDLIIEKIESKLTAKSIKELPHLDMVVITEPKIIFSSPVVKEQSEFHISTSNVSLICEMYGYEDEGKVSSSGVYFTGNKYAELTNEGIMIFKTTETGSRYFSIITCEM